jgi:hypothetical protein
MTALSAVVIWALAASAALAYQIQFTNVYGCPGFYLSGASNAANWYSPIATTGGALWINTGRGPVLYGTNDESPQTDFNMQLNVEIGSTWETAATYLLSNGTSSSTNSDGSTNGGATYDFTGWNYPGSYYPGMFWAQYPNLPGIPNTPAYYSASYNMELYFWTGNYNTYAAAQAAAQAETPGVYIADSGIFNQELLGAPYVPGAFSSMPAAILSQNPVTLIPGDANGDGRVDINDLTIVLAHYGQTLAPGSWAEGDFTGDGVVDINDLTIVLAHYGQTSSAGALAAVPEPASAVLLVCCGLAALLTAAVRRYR